MNTPALNPPLVGLLYNPAVPYIVDQVDDLVQYIGVIPERFWYDLGTTFGSRERFRRLDSEIDTFKRCSAGRVVAGHGVGLSLPSAVPLDTTLLDQNASFAAEAGFAWYSEHLSVFLTPHASAPNAQAALGLPVVYDEETYGLVRDKVRQLQQTLDCEIILENGSIFTAIPEMPMTEPGLSTASSGNGMRRAPIFVTLRTFRHWERRASVSFGAHPDAVVDPHGGRR